MLTTAFFESIAFMALALWYKGAGAVPIDDINGNIQNLLRPESTFNQSGICIQSYSFAIDTQELGTTPASVAGRLGLFAPCDGL